MTDPARAGGAVPAHQPDHRACPVCGSALPAPAGRGRERRYCGRACQQAAYRARHHGPGDPAARLGELLAAVAACQTALRRDQPAALAAAARAAAAAARALARAARQSITPEPVTKPPGATPHPTSHPASPGTVSTTRRPTAPDTTPTPTPTPQPGPPDQPPADLDDGYTLQPPTQARPTRWWLCHQDRQIGYIERVTIVGGRTTRWRAYTPTGVPITATTAGRDGSYRTKRDALVQVALQHRITQPARPARRQRPR